MTNRNNFQKFDKWLWLPFAVFALCGILFYNKIDSPFGNVFWGSLYIGSAALFTFLLRICWRAIITGKKWLTISGYGLGAVFTLAALLVLVLFIDYRYIFSADSIPEEMTTEKWRADLAFLAEEMPKAHLDFFKDVHPDTFAAHVSALEKRIDELNDYQIIAEMMKLVALPDDGHSWLQPVQPAINARLYPISAFWFSDGTFVVNAADEYRDCIGTKLIAINDHKIEAVFRAFKPLIGAENELNKRFRFQYMGMVAELLYALQITDSPDEATFTFQKDGGETFRKVIPPAPFYTWGSWAIFLSAENSSSPAISNNRKDWYWFELQESKTLYLQLNQMLNQPNKDETLSQFTDRLRKFVDTNDFERVVIDIRNNGGGNNQLLRPLIDLISDHPKINRRGRLFTIIGRRTYSAAVNFASMLETRTKTLFAGEASGQGPNLFGDNRPIYLPHSRIQIDLSSRWWEGSISEDRRSQIVPDLPVDYSHQDFLDNHDPVMAAILDYSPTLAKHHLPENFKTLKLAQGKTNGSESEPIISGQTLQSYVGRYLFSPSEVLTIERDGEQLYFSISGSPSGIFKAKSSLYPLSETHFSSDINGVGFAFSADTIISENDTVLTVYWASTERHLKKLPPGFRMPLELMASDKPDEVKEGIALIQGNRSHYLENFPRLEQQINSLGYEHLNRNQSGNAILAFQLNTELFPDSWNTFDSLAEGYLKNGDKENAIRLYKKALEMNPDSEHTRKMLSELE